MTQEEMCQWIGVPPGTELNPKLVEVLTPLDFPHSDEEHIAVFSAFLKGMPRPRKVIRGSVQR